MSEIICTKCGNKLSLGTMSTTVAARMSPQGAVENMARMLGWKRTASGWECKAHD